MQVLFDNGVPRGVAFVLNEHVIEEARDRGWDRLTNGELLGAAEVAGFEVLLTTDRNPERFSVGGAARERWNVEMMWARRAGD